MAITDIIQIAQKTAEIEIEGTKHKIHKLTVDETEEYQDIKNGGFGTIKAGIGGMREQSANLNMQKVNHADYEANKYLVKTSFSIDGYTCTDEDMNNLYDLFPVVVEELKKVNKLDLDEKAQSQFEIDVKKQ